MTGPQITMALMIVWDMITSFFNNRESMPEADKFIGVVIGTITRAIMLYGVLYWGGFWN